MHFTSLVIAGGALKIVSVAGCLKYLEERSLLNNIKNVVGTSAGALASLMVVLGYSYSEMVDHFYTCLNDQELLEFDPDECINIFQTYGMNSGKCIDILVQKTLYKKIKQKDITFIELAKMTGKNLVVCVHNLTKEKYEFFNVDTMPHLSVVTAIRVSCSLPILFTPITINNDVYIDGGMYNNFPIDYFKTNLLKDIIGINVIFTNYKKTDTFVNYLMFIMNSLIDKANVKSINDVKRNIVTLEFTEDDWFSFAEWRIKFPKERMSAYILHGYNCAKDTFESL